MKLLSEQFKIIKKFIRCRCGADRCRCYAGQGDAEFARQAVEAITPAAEQGNVQAQFLLGLYYWGYHGDCGNLKAIYWFEKAADNGNAEAARYIMEIYRSYTAEPPAWMDAEQQDALILKWHWRWFDMLAAKADKDSANAAKELMCQYIEDCPEDTNPEDGIKITRKWYDRWIEIMTAKAKRGDSMDKWNLADVLQYGDNVPEELLDYFSDEDDKWNLMQAIALYKEIIADNGFLMKDMAYFRMGCAYNDLGLWEKALACFKKAAKLNWHEAYAKIGDAYRYGNGVEPDDEAARKWYRKGADVGEITAMLNLAECYKDGIGGKQDYEKAMDEYLYLAERLEGRGWKHQASGIGTALYEIGNMYLNGHGVQPDLKKAIRYFTLAVKKCNNGLAEDKLNELL